MATHKERESELDRKLENELGVKPSWIGNGELKDKDLESFKPILNPTGQHISIREWVTDCSKARCVRGREVDGERERGLTLISAVEYVTTLGEIIFCERWWRSSEVLKLFWVWQDENLCEAIVGFRPAIIGPENEPKKVFLRVSTKAFQ
ncbi:predicted protein [Sclerotinia sclerotiorum 1980 UF-70]|uniref:Uncharacterized protein n=1 Tax=Sclerotinia sclerotiorum (strain ATCC 18683 / 1980 / Ss-1) TaxID=665079 RepID=A7F5K1_SCLS1|nr:predicted protein [Sclerotinia sclerotiorum 1980 UF-70]EDN98022.1 predicted protein [Sclerotinia sclerotiorum 1980 UF-70]